VRRSAWAARPARRPRDRACERARHPQDVARAVAAGAGLAALMAAATAVEPFTAAHEGKRNVGYHDIAHPTDSRFDAICYGHTQANAAGARATDPQCGALLTADEEKAARAIAVCLPAKPLPPGRRSSLRGRGLQPGPRRLLQVVHGQEGERGRPAGRLRGDQPLHVQRRQGLQAEGQQLRRHRQAPHRPAGAVRIRLGRHAAAAPPPPPPAAPHRGFFGGCAGSSHERRARVHRRPRPQAVGNPGPALAAWTPSTSEGGYRIRPRPRTQATPTLIRGPAPRAPPPASAATTRPTT
jgi:hypothetical protein